MAKNIVKVSGGKSSFRIIIPRKLVEKMGWEKAEYVIVEDHHPEYIKIRRLFDAETPTSIDQGDRVNPDR